MMRREVQNHWRPARVGLLLLCGTTVAALLLANAVRLTRIVRAQAVQAWAGHSSVVAAVDASLVPTMRYLPPRGRVGYTRPGFSWARAEDMGTFFMAQYALAPRVLVHAVVDDWVIAVPREGADPEVLDGYVLSQEFESGIRLYRRQVPTP